MQGMAVLLTRRRQKSGLIKQQHNKTMPDPHLPVFKQSHNWLLLCLQLPHAYCTHLDVPHCYTALRIFIWYSDVTDQVDVGACP